MAHKHGSSVTLLVVCRSLGFGYGDCGKLIVHAGRMITEVR